MIIAKVNCFRERDWRYAAITQPKYQISIYIYIYIEQDQTYATLFTNL